MSTYTQTQARPPPAALGRKNSFFGAIKNIVTAPLSWFGGSEEDFDDSDARGKRRRLPIASEQTRDDSDSDSEQRTKRMRMGSPNRDKQPYLDPPRSALGSTIKHLKLYASKISVMFRRRHENLSVYLLPHPVIDARCPLTQVDHSSRHSRLREPSMSNLRMRMSVTPQPSGSDFGPVVPPRRERDPTEPPPLTTLDVKPHVR
ncbi:hypothetical protein EDB19DRAFT_1375919 [Suillus lakei]|nr:hypothetical protein EDB19DRAFT_1375919 [Suillus lakei]